MLLAVFFFSCMGMLVKLLPEIPAVEIVFFRSIISLIISVSLLRLQKVSVWGNNKAHLLLRGAFGSVALILYFLTLQKIPLASAVVLGFLAPVFTTLIGVPLLGEKVYRLQWLFFLLAFVGVLLVETYDARVPTTYLCAGIAASLASGIAQNFIRKMKKSEHPLVIIFYFPLIATPISAMYCIFSKWVTPQGVEWLLLLAIGLLTQVAQFYMTKSIQLEQLNKVTIIRYMSIVYALSFGYFIFDERYNVLALGGMLLAVAGVVLNVWYKSWKDQAAPLAATES